MSSLWHLLWIAPLASVMGLVTAVLCIESSFSDEELKEIQDADWREI